MLCQGQSSWSSWNNSETWNYVLHDDIHLVHEDLSRSLVSHMEETAITAFWWHINKVIDLKCGPDTGFNKKPQAAKLTIREMEINDLFCLLRFLKN